MACGIRAIDLPGTRATYYAPATVTSQPASSWLHVSGQPRWLVNGGIPSDYESQIHLALLNLHKVLVAAGASIPDIALTHALHCELQSPATQAHSPSATLPTIPSAGHIAGSSVSACEAQNGCLKSRLSWPSPRQFPRN